MTVGFVIGESRPNVVTGQTSRPLSVGEYVIIDSANGKLLGLVEKSFVSSAALADVRNFDEAQESKEIADINTRDKSFKSKLQFWDIWNNYKMAEPLCQLFLPYQALRF